MNIRDVHNVAMSLIEHCSLNTILSEGTKTEKTKQTKKQASPPPSPPGA